LNFSVRYETYHTRILFFERCVRSTYANVFYLSVRESSSLGRHRWQAILPIAIDVTVQWSVCHVRTLCSSGRMYRHNFCCLRQPHVSPRSC